MSKTTNIVFQILTVFLCAALVVDPSMAAASRQTSNRSMPPSLAVWRRPFESQALNPSPVWFGVPLLKWKSLPAACRRMAGVLAASASLGFGSAVLVKSAIAAAAPIVTVATTLAAKTSVVPLEITVHSGDGPIRIARHVLGAGSRWRELFQYFHQWGTPEHFVIHPGTAHGILAASHVPPTLVMHQIQINFLERLLLHPADLLAVILAAAVLVGLVLWLVRRIRLQSVLRWALAGLLSVGIMSDFGRRFSPLPAAVPFSAASFNRTNAGTSGRHAPPQRVKVRASAARPARHSPGACNPGQVLRKRYPRASPGHMPTVKKTRSFVQPAWPLPVRAASEKLPEPPNVPAASMESAPALDFVGKGPPINPESLTPMNPAAVAAKATEAAVETLGIDLDQDPEEGPEGEPKSHWFEFLPGDKEVGIETKYAADKNGASTTLEARVAVADATSPGGTIGDAIAGPSVETQWALEHHPSGQAFSEVARLGAAADLNGMHEAQVFVGLSGEKTNKRKSAVLKGLAGFVFGEEDGAMEAGPAAFEEGGFRVGSRGAISASAGAAPRTGPFLKANAQFRILNKPKISLYVFGRIVIGKSLLVHLHGGPGVGIRLIFRQPSFFHKRKGPHRRIIVSVVFNPYKLVIPDIGVGLEPLSQESQKTLEPPKEAKKMSKSLRTSA